LDLCKEIKQSPIEKLDPNIVTLYKAARQSIYAQLKGQVMTLSCHKFASNVVEKSLLQGSPQEIEAIAIEILGISSG